MALNADQRRGDVMPRVVVSSDFPPLDVIPGGSRRGPDHKRSDPDDVQSMVRFLVSTNAFQVEGLIAAAGTLANVANKHHLFDILDRYDHVVDTLQEHDASYPTAEELRSVTTEGLDGTYGQPASEILGDGCDSEASEHIIDLLEDPNPHPIWFLF